MQRDKPTVIIAGASLGLGSALCRTFLAANFQVLAMGRHAATQAVADAVAGVRAVACDFTQPSEVREAMAQIESHDGPPEVVVYAAHRFALGPFLETPIELFEQAWQSNCLGAAVIAQSVLPGMLARGTGCLLFAGATMSKRGGQRTAALAASKFALRGLAQSLAVEYGPRGIHVAHVVLDGLIASAQTTERFSAAEQDCMNADEVAQVFAQLALQPRSTWTHETDVRPWKERFTP